MRPVALLALAAVALTASPGCVTDGGGEGSSPEATTAGECSRFDAGDASRNAPLVPALRGEPVDVAARVADAVGDPLASRDAVAARSSPDAPQWDTKSGGSVIVRTSAGAFAGVHWTHGDAPRRMTESEARGFLEATLGALDVPDGAVTRPVNTNNADNPVLWFAQAFRGGTVQGAHGTLRASLPSLDLYGLHDLSAAEPRVSAQAARDAAVAHARCQLDRDGRTEKAGYGFEGVAGTSWAVSHETLVHAVSVTFHEPEEGHCGLVVVVEVDAVTGGVVGWGYPPCD